MSATKAQMTKKFWTKDAYGDDQFKVCMLKFTVSELKEDFWTIAETYENFATKAEAKKAAVAAAEKELGFQFYLPENAWKVW